MKNITKCSDKYGMNFFAIDAEYLIKYVESKFYIHDM